MPPSTPGAPLKLGDSKVLNTWVHDPKESAKVIFNQSWWPGVAEGDLLRVTQSESTSGYLFVVPKDEGCPKPTLQANSPQFWHIRQLMSELSRYLYPEMLPMHFP